MNSLEAIKMTAALTEALKDVRFTPYDLVEKFGAALHAKGYMIVKNPDFVPVAEVPMPAEILAAPVVEEPADAPMLIASEPVF